MLSYANRWKEVGLNKLERSCHTDSVVKPVEIAKDGSVIVTAKWTLTSPNDCDIRISIECEVRYVFYISECIEIEISMSCSPMTPVLARTGLRWTMPGEYSRVRYFGLGPHEAYEDRKSCCYLGVFEGDVSEFHTNYTYPQECGRRADPRYIHTYAIHSYPIHSLVFIYMCILCMCVRAYHYHYLISSMW